MISEVILWPLHTCTYVRMYLHTHENTGSGRQKLYGGLGSSLPLICWCHLCLVSRNHVGTQEIIQKWLVDLTYTEKLCLSKSVPLTTANVTC